MSQTIRTHSCHQLASVATGTVITVNGWVNRRRDHGGVIFIDARDRSGLVQLVFDPAYTPELVMKLVHTVRNEFVISATGAVAARAAAAVNEKLATGRIEIAVTSLVILNTAKPLPFQLDEAEQVDEELRLKYRYLDLRREKMQKMLFKRQTLIVLMWNYLPNLISRVLVTLKSLLSIHLTCTLISSSHIRV